MACLRKRPWWHATSKVVASTTDNEVDDELPSFIWEMYRNPRMYKDDLYRDVMLNHLERNSCLVTKKGLYLSLKAYCDENKEINLLNLIPQTYYLASGSQKQDEPRSKDMADFLAFNAGQICGGSAGGGSTDHSHELVIPIQEDQYRLTFPPIDRKVVVPPFGTIPASGSLPKSISGIAVDKDAQLGAIWILKPASKTNRGFGIKVVRGVKEVLDIVNRPASSRIRKLKSFTEEKDSVKGQKGNCEAKCGDKATLSLSRAAGRAGAQEGWIVQLYMDRPMLVSGRKFDIRCFVLATNFPGESLRAYFFKDAYVRTSSKKYSLVCLSDREAHLTNDAVQNKSKTYGKFEDGNKLSFSEWQTAILRDYPHASPNIVEEKFRPEMIRLSAISIAAAAKELQRTKIHRSFELLGYDYMVDNEFRITLIEINSNPCLEFVCPLLSDIISSLLENVVIVALDTQLPPPGKSKRTSGCHQAILDISQQDAKFFQIYP